MTYLQLIKHFGNLTKAAQALDLQKQTVHYWKKVGRIPDDRQLQIWALSGLTPDKRARKRAGLLSAWAQSMQQGDLQE